MPLRGRKVVSPEGYVQQYYEEISLCATVGERRNDVREIWSQELWRKPEDAGVWAI